jgi:hypothetical protein
MSTNAFSIQFIASLHWSVLYDFHDQFATLEVIGVIALDFPIELSLYQVLMEQIRHAAHCFSPVGLLAYFSALWKERYMIWRRLLKTFIPNIRDWQSSQREILKLDGTNAGLLSLVLTVGYPGCKPPLGLYWSQCMWRHFNRYLRQHKWPSKAPSAVGATRLHV